MHAYAMHAQYLGIECTRDVRAFRANEWTVFGCLCCPCAPNIGGNTGRRDVEKRAMIKKTNPMKYLRIKKNTRPRKVTHRKKCYVFDLLNCILIFHLVLSAGTRIHDAFPNHVIVGSLLFEMSRVWAYVNVCVCVRYFFPAFAQCCVCAVSV